MPAIAAKALAGWRSAAMAAAIALAASVKGQALLLAYIAVYLGISIAATHLVPGASAPEFELFALSFILGNIPIFFLSLVTVRFLRLAIHVRPKRPIAALFHDLKDFLGSPSRLVLGVPLILTLSLFIKSYTNLKYNIPVFAPYSWDEALMIADRWLHFGRHPWEWLQPVLGYPIVTMALNVLYNLWFIIMWSFWMMLAFAQRPSVLRTQFFLSFLFIWSVGGSAMAMLMPSVGPCYYSLVGLSPDPYQPLMAYLKSANEVYPIWALATQDMLWNAYVGTDHTFGGISAMPSMHNASTLLFALTAWRISRRLGMVMYGYVFVIFIGSVHLGWHYAVDAYIAWAVVAAIWWISGQMARWNETTSWARDLERICAAMAPGRQARAVSPD